MKTLCCAAAIAVVLSGCAPLPTKSLDAGASLQGRQVVLSHYAKPDFSAMTTGKALFGVIGALAMVNAGNQMVNADSIDDPAIEIGQRLASDMAAKHSVTVLPPAQQVAKDDKPSSLVKTYSGADVILDVRTSYWMYSYYPSNWARYRVMYAARVRLLDGKSGALLAQQVCKFDPGDSEHAPTHDALRADHSALVKKFLREAADTCVSEVERQSLRV